MSLDHWPDTGGSESQLTSESTKESPGSLHSEAYTQGFFQFSGLRQNSTPDLLLFSGWRLKMPDCRRECSEEPPQEPPCEPPQEPPCDPPEKDKDKKPKEDKPKDEKPNDNK